MFLVLQKKFWLSALLSLFIVFNVSAQMHDPTDWSSELIELENGEVELLIKVDIEDHWHLYTQEVPDADDAPLPTQFYFPENEHIERIGKVEESESITAFEEISQLNISFFEHKAEFRQKVKNHSDKDVGYSVEVEFMVCDDKMCLPPEIEVFSFIIPAPKVASTSVEENLDAGEILSTENAVSINSEDDLEEIFDPVNWDFKIEPKGEQKYELIITANIEETWHLYALELESDDGPVETEINLDTIPGIAYVGDVKVEGEVKNEYDPNFMMNLSYYEGKVEFRQEFESTGESNKLSGNVYYMSCDAEKCIPPDYVDFNLDIPLPAPKGTMLTGDNVSKSYWGTFLGGFLFGFVALLTPCVFPMIPLTVSFFIKQSKTRAKGISNAALYSFSIIAIYVLLGYGITAIFGADALNQLSTDPYFNIFFFVLLVVFAISFFGAFEITLPSSWVNKADSASNRGGILGIFFMAFTLSLVSFSCTGPIIGTLLVDAAVNGGILGPVIGMFGFSLALALPFGLFAAFPAWLNSLPSSGGWLNSVKVVLGFLELAFAFKFLSNADLVWQAGLLKREVFIAIWIAIFTMMTAYLLGFFHLPHDSKNERISVTRLMFAVASLMFTIYLIPGIWGAPLKMIAGFPPPMFYSESPQGLGGSKVIAAAPSTNGEVAEVVGEPEHCPHQLNCFHDYEEGLAYAKEIGKPVMLDFTGWACVNCRKMEEQVWSDPGILKILREDVVLISLYVDEKIPLPEEEQKTVQIGDKMKKLRTVGNKWAYMQAVKYETNAQPYYVIIDHDENTMNGSAAYDPDIEKFRLWLREGIDRFNTTNVASIE